ncbi:MAG: hypothetical protein H7240_02445 [Glaciimonas sp.]|nr:hypothetical protein [Glaciimonas sp.]
MGIAIDEYIFIYSGDGDPIISALGFSVRNVFLALLFVLVLFSGEWVYRSFLRPVDQPTSLMKSLAQHFNAVGLKGSVYPVRHGYRHSQISAAAAFKIEGYPLPVSITQCADEAAAERHLRAVESAPNLMHAQRKGLLVLDLPMWGDDTDAMATKVTNAFATFKSET